MASTSVGYSPKIAESYRSEAKVAVPWYVWCSALAVTSDVVGAHWDISWHRSIGRDAFWTPAHIAIYMCGVLAAISCGYSILTSTFNRNGDAAENTVRIWGFRGPLGAFIAAWGGITMLTSAPFDNWWHAAYGLDVKIVSPPHSVLFLGATAVVIGSLILTLGQMNTASGKTRRWLEYLFLYLGAQTVLMLMTLLSEFTGCVHLHSSLPYRLMAIFIPFVLAAVGSASGHRFSATLISAYYMCFVIAEILFLPLFPAEPKLGPVYQHITHFIPAQFPILLVVPALALDLYWQHKQDRSRFTSAAISAVLFTGALLITEWPFANFLQSPLSRNAFFGMGYLSYGTNPNSLSAQHQFEIVDTGIHFWINMACATAFAFVSTWIGLAWGSWMRTVKR
jgi:hypothetical protein